MDLRDRWLPVCQRQYRDHEMSSEVRGVLSPLCTETGHPDPLYYSRDVGIPAIQRIVLVFAVVRAGRECDGGGDEYVGRVSDLALNPLHCVALFCSKVLRDD